MSRLSVPSLESATGAAAEIYAFATTVFTNVFNRINDTAIDFPAVA